MKKLFALLLSVAMVASLFVGVAFASEDKAEMKITLTNDTLIWGETSYRVTGNITANGSTPVGIVEYKVTVEGDHVYTGVTANGTIDITLPVKSGDDVRLAVNKDYNVEIVKWTKSGAEQAIDWAKTKAAKLKTRYNMTVDQTLNLTYLDKNVVVSGRVTDSKGNAVGNLSIEFTGGPEGIKTFSNGMFAFNVDQVTVGGTNAFKINAGGVEYKAYNVAALGFSTLTVSPASTIHTAIPTTLKFVTKEKVGSEPEANVTGATFTLTGVKIDVASVNADHIETDAKKSIKTDDGKYYTQLVIKVNETTVKFVEAGTVNIVANWGDKRTGTLTLPVAAPGAVNVLNVPAKINVAPNTLKLDVRLANGNNPASVKVAATGAGVDVKEATVAKNDDGFYHVNVAPKQQGNITLTVKAFDANDKLIDTVTKTIEVTGYTITISHSEVTVGTENNIVVTVFNGATPINNAYLTLDGIADVAALEVNPTTANISNGVYTFTKAKFAKVGTLKLTVKTPSGTVMAEIDNAVKVLGEEVYTVTVDKTAILAGSKTNVKFTVTNANGARVNNAKLDVYVDGNTITTENVDTENGVKTIEINAAKSLKVVAHTDGKTKIGSVVVDVKAPIVQISNSKITEGVKELITVKLVNPIDGTDLDGYTLVPVNSFTTHNLYKSDAKNTAYGDFAAAKEWTFFAMVTDNRTKEEKEAGKVPELLFNVAKDKTVTVKQAVAVAPATLTLSTNTLYIEQNTQLIITLKDAHGVGMKNREVKVNGTVIGNTDDNGVIVYNFRPMATGNVNFTAALDNNTNVTATAKATIDTVKPEIKATVTATVDGIVVAGTITDNTLVNRLVINNLDVVIIPAGTVNFNHILPANTKTVNIMAFDIANNGALLTLAAPALPAAPKTVITIGKANPAIGLDQPANVKNGRLMLPFRWFGEKILEATVDYKVVGSAEIVTLHKGSTHIELTLNSTIAKVNGVPVALDVAPYATGGRTLVPARFLAETFGFEVVWNPVNDEVTITKK